MSIYEQPESNQIRIINPQEPSLISRREVVKGLTTLPAFLYLQSFLAGEDTFAQDSPPQTGATVYKATDPDPAKATRNLIASLGGIESIIDKNDIVVLKPNSQWWHQGMTNTDVMAAFIELVLAIPGFQGEIIIADSHQSKKLDDRAWTTEFRNGKFNYNEQVKFFQDKGHANVTKYHWNPAGPNPTPLQMDGFGDAVVNHPSDGDGYIWPENLFYECPYGNKCLLAYPVFTSPYSGVTVDLKNGAFKNGQYTKQPIKFINFSAINHHSRYGGVTASIKNYMGVVDMSCGYPAPNPPGLYNTHHIGVSLLFKFLTNNRRRLADLPYYYDLYLHPAVFRFRFTGGVLGRYMAKVRKADLNIITAVKIGWGSRIETKMAARTDTITASTDPVALDFWTAANILLPATKAANAPEKFLNANDPTITGGPFYRFLNECRKELGGTLDPALIQLVEA